MSWLEWFTTIAIAIFYLVLYAITDDAVYFICANIFTAVSFISVKERKS